MQDLWGRVLAGEVAQPGKYSLRSLETLRNLTQREAEAFRHLRYLATDGGYVFKVAGNDLNDFDVTFQDILDLRAAGLVSDGDMLTTTFKPPVGQPFFATPFNGKVLLFEVKDATANWVATFECLA